MNREFIDALDALVKEKGISKDVMMETIEAALVSAYKKNFGSSGNIMVNIDEETGYIEVLSRHTVVEELDDENVELTLEEAKDIDPRYEIGDIVDEVVTPNDFGRIAAQTAKQVVVQRIREAERGIIFNEYSSRESEIVNGTVQRFSKGTIFINLGKTEAMLLASEQIPGETYPQGGRIKSFIIEVKNATKGPQILVSRTHPGLVKRLFELEVPEIYDGEVEIRGISREAGSRTKIAVFAPDENIDPVGSCVGPKGQRVQAIVDELNGEKIDIIKWSEDPEVYISNSLSPSKVVRVEVNEEEHSALVVVPDYQLSLAIGKEGQNARLAAKLTSWKIDIKSESQYSEMLDGQVVEEETFVEEEYDSYEEADVETEEVYEDDEVSEDID